MTALHVLPPTSYIGAIESMTEVFKQIAVFQAANLTYEIAGDLYLSIAECPGALEDLPFSLEESLRIFKERGGDPDRVGKKHPLDTLLWLKGRPNEPAWESPFGAGRPGWHIECAAIALKYASGNPKFTLTIQGGGSDLIFPHHYMSGVQGRNLVNREFAEIYTHTGMIGLAGEKMSKSKGNLVFVSKLLAEGVDPVVIRVNLMQDRYRNDRMWSGAGLAQAEEKVLRIRSALSREEVAPTKPLINEIISALSSDLDTPKVFELVDRWCFDTEAGQTGGSSGEIARAFDALLGLTF
jgi:L-cysteine:1D-myo-inositol 2-amino-2-deoxy-alpha-D-glucopyranoside ligase